MPEIMHPGEAPREVDCPCSERHIIDPAASERALRKRKFTCTVCGHRYRTHLVGAFSMDDHGSAGPVCMRCAFNHLTALVEQLRAMVEELR